jgi:CheY-like chemotaxis protein
VVMVKEEQRPFTLSDSMSKLVLVVDDNPDILELQSMVLQAEGYDVVTASSGPDALERLKEIPKPELVLLDVDLGEMSGPEFIHYADQLFPHFADEVPVVFMTACSPPQNTRAVGAIDKMCDLESYVAAVNNYLERYAKDRHHEQLRH